MQIKWIIYCVLIALTVTSGCVPDEESDSKGGGTGGEEPQNWKLEIFNKSQFDIHHIFVYNSNGSYRTSTSQIDSESPLTIGNSLELTVTAGEYKVTVTRLKSISGPLWAFTTRYSFKVDKDLNLEYFDYQFRLSDTPDSSSPMTSFSYKNFEIYPIEQKTSLSAY